MNSRRTTVICLIIAAVSGAIWLVLPLPVEGAAEDLYSWFSSHGVRLAVMGAFWISAAGAFGSWLDTLIKGG